MIQLQAGVPEPILLTEQDLNEGTWYLTSIRDLEGDLAGLDQTGAALAYPLTMTRVEGVSAYVSPPVQLINAGKYVAVLTHSTERVLVEPVIVTEGATSRTSSSGSTVSPGDPYGSAWDLVQRYGDEEIAQLGDQGIPRLVTGEMMRIAAQGGDVSGYTEEEQAAIEWAMEHLLEALQDATTIIDGYLRNRYSLPLVEVPATVVRWCCEMTRYLLHDNGAPEHVSKRYAETIALLTSVSNGKVDLGLNGAQESTTTIGGASGLKSSDERIFSSTTLGGF